MIEQYLNIWLAVITLLSATVTGRSAKKLHDYSRGVLIGELINNKEHKTIGAQVLKNDLSCYTCDTAVEGDRCVKLATGNSSLLLKKCYHDNTICMVKQFSYTTSTENSTSILKTWSLQRNCSAKCESGCIMIGERTKLYACTACCTSSACNTMKGSPASAFSASLALSFLIPLISIFLIPTCR